MFRWIKDKWNQAFPSDEEMYKRGRREAMRQILNHGHIKAQRDMLLKFNNDKKPFDRGVSDCFNQYALHNNGSIGKSAHAEHVNRYKL